MVSLVDRVLDEMKESVERRVDAEIHHFNKEISRAGGGVSNQRVVLGGIENRPFTDDSAVDENMLSNTTSGSGAHHSQSKQDQLVAKFKALEILGKDTVVKKLLKTIEVMNTQLGML